MALHQESLDLVWNHFLIQGNPPSVQPGPEGDPECMYVGPQGNRCAFALLLTPEELAKVREGSPAWAVIRDLNLNRFQIGVEADRFYTLLQQAHDFSAASAMSTLDTTLPPNLEVFRTGLRSRLTTLAHQYRLRIPV